MLRDAALDSQQYTALGLCDLHMAAPSHTQSMDVPRCCACSLCRMNGSLYTIARFGCDFHGVGIVHVQHGSTVAPSIHDRTSGIDFELGDHEGTCTLF